MYQQISIAAQDPEVWAAIDAENKRQEDYIELIASENYTSPAVMAAQGSQLTNKYAEGYPAKRYYGGCENVDVVERIAQERAKKLFCEPAGVEMAVNVQPHSGAQANMAVEFAFLQPGRPSFPRHEAQFFRQVLPLRALRPERRRGHRL